MFAVVAPVIRPVNVALVIVVGPVRTKSSADSISNFPALSGRVAVPILPSGLPVMKKNGDAAAGPARKSRARTAAEKDIARVMFIPPYFLAGRHSPDSRITIRASRFAHHAFLPRAS